MSYDERESETPGGCCCPVPLRRLKNSCAGVVRALGDFSKALNDLIEKQETKDDTIDALRYAFRKQPRKKQYFFNTNRKNFK